MIFLNDPKDVQVFLEYPVCNYLSTEKPGLNPMFDYGQLYLNNRSATYRNVSIFSLKLPWGTAIYVDHFPC